MSVQQSAPLIVSEHEDKERGTYMVAAESTDPEAIQSRGWFEWDADEDPLVSLEQWR